MSAPGSDHVWAENSHENQLTPWSNDPVTYPTGDAIWLHDLDTGATWTATALPFRNGGHYVVRRGFGSSRFEHAAHGIDASLLQFVPVDDPVRISRLTPRNMSGRMRRVPVSSCPPRTIAAGTAGCAALA